MVSKHKIFAFKQIDKNAGEKTSETIVEVLVWCLIIVAMGTVILPMLIKGGDYCFPIHDEMDSFAGSVQRIYNLKSFFHMNEGQSFAGGLNNHYSILSMGLYTGLCCLLGYINGEICTRIISVILGFLSFRLLAQKLFSEKSRTEIIITNAIACLYAITSSAPNRQIAFATLPLIVFAYLTIRDYERFKLKALLCVFYPFVTQFNAIHVFVMGFWFLLTIIESLKKRKLHTSLIASFVSMVISTLLVYHNSLWLSFIASDTNRVLFSESAEPARFDWDLFKKYLMYGQYHSSAQQGAVLLPILLSCSLSFLLIWLGYRQFRDKNRISAKILLCGWVLWLVSAFVETFQESGFDTGITLIDGFQWGRLVSFMRLFWYLIALALVMVKPIENLKKFICILIPILGIAVLYILNSWGLSNSTLWGGGTDNIIKIVVWGLTIAMPFLLLYKTGLFKISLFITLVMQFFVLIGSTYQYNDVGASVFSDGNITLNEFFSTELFDDIKSDINYDFDNEWVAAYGFHPSILMYNGFNTIDRYNSVHSMRDQEEFRKIIAPALELYDEWREYYDTWGGRMYLFGELSFAPTKIKCDTDEEYPLYINLEEFKKYRGKYILSRALISNADEIGLDLVKDYDFEGSLYHIYLYVTR